MAQKLEPMPRVINADRWLAAHEDPLANIFTFSSCLSLADLTGDGESNLIVADLGSESNSMKLRVYRGTLKITENTIIDLPTGVVTLHMDQNEPRIPAVAVASGSHIYIYKNMRPYFKFTLPTLDIHSKEKELWSSAAASDTPLEAAALFDALQNLRNEIGDSLLTARSQRLLMINDRTELQSFVELHKGFVLKRQTVVTCIATMKKSHLDDNAVSCLVLGTEASCIYILDPEAFTIMESMETPSPPSLLAVNGLYDVDFRIVVTCRNATLGYLKRGFSSTKCIAMLDSQAVGLLRRDKSILVALTDCKMVCYSTKGKVLWKLNLDSHILCLEPVDIPNRGLQLAAIALGNNQVLLYNDKDLVDCITMSDVVSSMKFGRFGREDCALVMVTGNGGLYVKILKRTAQFEKIEMFRGSRTIGQQDKLDIPKKTKLYVDQTLRERENSIMMHRTFQRDLYLLRLRAARAFVQSIKTSTNPISSTESDEPIKLSAQVLGLGPVFRLIIGLCNVSSGQPSRDLIITFYCDDKLYLLDKNVIFVPMLVPGLEYTFENMVTCVSDLGITDQIRVFVSRNTFSQSSAKRTVSSRPMLSAIINMPVAETV